MLVSEIGEIGGEICGVDCGNGYDNGKPLLIV